MVVDEIWPTVQSRSIDFIGPVNIAKKRQVQYQRRWVSERSAKKWQINSSNHLWAVGHALQKSILSFKKYQSLLWGIPEYKLTQKRISQWNLYHRSQEWSAVDSCNLEVC